jgi:AcrR family transcriptional regulator
LRADAARNRGKLLAAAAEVFGECGLDAPLDQVARLAGVSIGTLYNHFPDREALFAAIYPQRIAALDRVAEAAMRDPDPWHGFVSFVEGLFALQAQDRGLNDAVARNPPGAADPAVTCSRGFGYVDAIIDRAKSAGELRADFEPGDLTTLVWAMSRVIQEGTDTAPHAWRRCLAFFLDGLRPDAAHPIPDELRARPGSSS